MDSFVATGSLCEGFHRDVVKAFSASNVPLSKLNAGVPLAFFFVTIRSCLLSHNEHTTPDALGQNCAIVMAADPAVNDRRKS